MTSFDYRLARAAPLAVATTFALLTLAACGGGGGGSTSMMPPGDGSANPQPTPVVPVSILGRSIDVIHLERTDLHSTLRNFPGVLPVQGTDLRVDGNGPLRRNLTCPGIPPRGNECTLTHYTFDAAGGARYAAREHPTVNLDRSIGDVIRNELNNLRPVNALHGIRMYETDVTGIGIQAPTESYGGYGEWMSFHVIGPTPAVAASVLTNAGLFTIGAASYGNLYVDPSGDSRPKDSAIYEGSMVGREHGWLGAKEVQGKSQVAYDFSAATVDVLLTEIVYRDTLRPTAHDQNVSWLNIPVNRDASFYIPGHGNHADNQNPHPSRGYIDGDFYGPQGQEVSGVFETKYMVGAFGAKRGN